MALHLFTAQSIFLLMQQLNRSLILCVRARNILTAMPDWFGENNIDHKSYTTAWATECTAQTTSKTVRYRLSIVGQDTERHVWHSIDMHTALVLLQLLLLDHMFTQFCVSIWCRLSFQLNRRQLNCYQQYSLVVVILCYCNLYKHCQGIISKFNAL